MIDYTEFGIRAKETGLRCVALVRHAERPTIDPVDPAYGIELPLTDKGQRMAEECGRTLAQSGPPLCEWAFLASPLRRTMMTAECVAAGMGADAGAVRASSEAGVPGIWMLNPLETHRRYRAEGMESFTDRFMRDGQADGYRPITDTVEAARKWLGRGFGARCAFVATHDVFAAVLLRGFGAMQASSAQWVGFLQGCAFFERSGGGWDVEYIVPDKSDWVNAVIQ